MSYVSLKPACIPNFDAAIISTCEEEDMIWGDSNVLDRANMLRESSDQNPFGLPWPIAGMVATPTNSLSSA
jgi:hypothetical protein